MSTDGSGNANGWLSPQGDLQIVQNLGRSDSKRRSSFARRSTGEIGSRQALYWLLVHWIGGTGAAGMRNNKGLRLDEQEQGLGLDVIKLEAALLGSVLNLR